MAQTDQGPGAAVVPADATHAVVCRIEFAEGEPEDSVWGFGTFEQCEKMIALTPAISYSGDRRAVNASAAIVPLREDRP